MKKSYKKPAPPSPSKVLIQAFNLVFVSLLRSPLHGLLDNSFILLSFKGRKSGREYTFPVGYIRNGDLLQIISPRGWWQNLRAGNVPVTILLKGEQRRGIAEAWKGNERVADEFQHFVKKSPSLIRMYHIEQDASGQPKPESIRQAATHIALIHIQLLPKE